MSNRPNPNCPVSGCRTDAPHVDDPTVKALMIAFAPPAEMTKWTLAAMAELAQSICRDLENKKVFAFHSRVRQPEELYIRTLYTLFVAMDEEIPHILSGATPNGYRRSVQSTPYTHARLDSRQYGPKQRQKYPNSRQLRAVSGA